MKTGTILLTMAGLFAAVCFAADVNIGTWKVNAAKSQNLPSDEKSTTMVIAPAGENMKVTVDGVDAKGKPFHEEWMGKFDGKAYPVTGDPETDTRVYKPINDRSLEAIEKKNGKITETYRIVNSADGKTRTVTATGTDAKGTKFSATIVYDKQ
jgi:hypothetical protein